LKLLSLKLGGLDTKMALLVVKREPNTATKDENILADLDSFLHSLRLEKMALSPEFYSDAKGGS
jgi:hypothetical protein